MSAATPARHKEECAISWSECENAQRESADSGWCCGFMDRIMFMDRVSRSDVGKSSELIQTERE